MATETEANRIIRDHVREKYDDIARGGAGPGCGPGCGCGPEDDSAAEAVADMSESYSGLEGYSADADLKLGCGLPTELAGIRPGDVVVDLGSGAGNDAFVARSLVGESGRVIGVDFAEAMVTKARENAEKLDAANVEFRLGAIEDLPLEDAMADVVISNCVLNLVPDKARAFAETHRVLRPGGHFCISDIVVEGELPPAVREAAELYAGCVAGASPMEDYRRIIERAGFENVDIPERRRIELPDSVLSPYLSDDDLDAFRRSGTALASVTVTGARPAGTCCRPGPATLTGAS